MSRNALVDLTLVLFHETERAFLVGDTGDRDKAVWLAKSLVEIDYLVKGQEREKVDGIRTTRTFPIHEFTVPEWLAAERGLV